MLFTIILGEHFNIYINEVSYWDMKILKQCNFLSVSGLIRLNESYYDLYKHPAGYHGLIHAFGCISLSGKSSDGMVKCKINYYCQMLEALKNLMFKKTVIICRT
jgi:hypothetical protein